MSSKIEPTGSQAGAAPYRRLPRHLLDLLQLARFAEYGIWFIASPQ